MHITVKYIKGISKTTCDIFASDTKWLFQISFNNVENTEEKIRELLSGTYKIGFVCERC